MSIKYIDAVLDRVEGLSSSQAFVLLILANSASDDVHECFPSIRTIARRTRLDERTVRRRLREIEELGLIETARGGHQYGKNMASRYRLLFDPSTGARLESPGELSTRGAPRPHRGGVQTGKGGVQAHQGGRGAPPSVIEPSYNQRGDKVAAKRKDVRELTDAELEELANTGRLTAEQERERELRKTMASRARRRA